MKTILRPLVVVFAVLSVICGVLYPLAVSGIGSVAFREQAAGSMVSRDGQVVGSTLIGQAFSSPHYFWGRPSATAPIPNNAAASGGSNLGPTNPALLDVVRQRLAALRKADPTNRSAVPVDLVTASASGVDPEISVAAAYYQAGRIARERGLDEARVRTMIDAGKSGALLGVLGEPRINVLLLNLELDRVSPVRATRSATSAAAPS